VNRVSVKEMNSVSDGALVALNSLLYTVSTRSLTPDDLRHFLPGFRRRVYTVDIDFITNVVVVVVPDGGSFSSRRRRGDERMVPRSGLVEQPLGTRRSQCSTKRAQRVGGKNAKRSTLVRTFEKRQTTFENEGHLYTRRCLRTLPATWVTNWSPTPAQKLQRQGYSAAGHRGWNYRLMDFRQSGFSYNRFNNC